MKILSISSLVLLSPILLTASNQPNQDYILTVIEDEATPLAPSLPENQLFPYALAAILIIFVFLLIMTYLARCRLYKKRILELQVSTSVKTQKEDKGFNVIYLKKRHRTLEEEAASKIVPDFSS